MRLEINLASQPYEDVRVFLLVTAFAGWWGARDVRQRMDLAAAEIQDLDHVKADAENLLSRPQNHDILERSRFLNGLIAHKAFSWTQLFMDLEKIMPPRVHVVSLQPEPSENQVALRLLVEGDSREHALDLVRRMEGSERFRLARVKSERGKEETRGVQLEILAYYAPEGRRGQP